MDNILSSQEFRDKLQELHVKRGITARLRTHLRHLILSELQNGPTAKNAPPLTNRSRAIGSLIVEWLQMHECHYTLSVLASEVPSFSDLPTLVGEGDQRSLKTEEIDDILVAIGLKSVQIREEYQRTSDSLLSCIIKNSAGWKERLEFRELPSSPTRGNSSWCTRLQELVSSFCLDQSQLSSLYGALHSLVTNEIESSLAQERHQIQQEMLEREDRIRSQIAMKEDNLAACLRDAEIGLNAAHEKVEVDMEEKKTLLAELVAEINIQQETVAHSLQALAEREKLLEVSRKSWKEKVAAEKTKRAFEMEEIKNKMKTLEMEKEQLKGQKEDFKKDSEVIRISRGTCTSPPPKEAPVTSFSPQERNHKQESGRNSDDVNNRPSASGNQRTNRERRRFNGDKARSRSPLFADSSSESLVSGENPMRISAAWRRLKELQKETDANRESFMEYRGNLAESDSSPSDNEENLRPRPSVSIFSASQMTFPTLHEGCHSGSNPTAFAQHRRSTRRYRQLMNQGDLMVNRRPSRRLENVPRVRDLRQLQTEVVRDFRPEEEPLGVRDGRLQPEDGLQDFRRRQPDNVPLPPLGVREATYLMRQESAKLESLLRSARQGGYKPQTSDAYTPKSQDTSRADALLEAVRTQTGEDHGEGKSRNGETENSIPESPLRGDGENFVREEEKDKVPLDPVEPSLVNRVPSEPTVVKLVPEEPDPVMVNEVPPGPSAGLLQAALGSNSDLSEGEVVSFGQASQNDDFWG